MTIGYFLTGTDTGVGKTRVGTAIARGLAARGLDVRVRKPVESGCPDIDGMPVPQDAEALRLAAGAREPLERVCRFRLRTPVSPERAAALEGLRFDAEALRDACMADAGGDVLLVEGAGGFCSPVAPGALNADLAAALGLPVVLVVADRLGAINHALLTLEAIARRGLHVAALVLSRHGDAGDAGMDNAADLARWSGRAVDVLPPGAAAGPSAWAEDAARLATLVERLAPRA
ncbi:dethiobiotin synthase [Lysobacter sp. N42]|jgi:dethiobiotin synthetase|uniref:dethiobiotin synthase n=1 Tax=Lysobacter sp. N42 TaxID=2545719 RepID=UPI00104C2188|nr:dethiobiotin synthase [Lysobacter sp. N42]TCZ82434.1 dethiobiotin synthase [Lysobacter sp. N42]